MSKCAEPRPRECLPMELVVDEPFKPRTLLFTDIVRSTRLWESSPAAMRVAVARHDALIREAVSVSGGTVFKTVGDAFHASYETPAEALRGALLAQAALLGEVWPDGAEIKVRMAIHTGEVESRCDDYFGPPLNRLARILACAHGGQVLVSGATRERLTGGLPSGITLKYLGQHVLRDLSGHEDIYQLCGAGLMDDFSPIRSLSWCQNNLPSLASSFLGREQELQKAKGLLASTRLLTITGAGGCGKTRLALQLAADSLDSFRDGVWYVELAALDDPALLNHAVASVLEVAEQPDKALIENVCRHLSQKQTLVVFDNCEHLLDECAATAASILKSCPEVQLLCTSRETLGIFGESTFRVPSMSVPPVQEDISVDEIQSYESVCLFLTRAKSANHNFVLRPESVRAVGEICRRLDGIPLAIELAASKTTALTPDQILTRLNHRFQILTGGDRSALPRQRTLRATIDWSFDLLSETQKALLTRLAVFSGGWTLAAVEAVCSNSGTAEAAIIEDLLYLVEKSLVQVQDPDSSIARYRLLETVREYASERLVASADSGEIRRKHYMYYLDIARLAEPGLNGEQQVVWLEVLSNDLENFRSALHWSIESAVGEGSYVLCGALCRFFYFRGFYSEGRRLARLALAQIPDQECAAVRAKLLNRAGVLARCQGDYEDAQACHSACLAQWYDLGSMEGVCFTLNNIGLVSQEQGDFDMAAAAYQEALEIARRTGNQNHISLSLNDLGTAFRDLGDFEAAEALCTQSLDICREIGDWRGAANSLTGLGLLEYERGNLRVARELQVKSLRIRRQLGDRRGFAYALESIAACVAEFDPVRAFVIWGAAEHLRERIGSPLSPSDREKYEKWLELARSRIRQTMKMKTAWELGRKMPLDEALNLAMLGKEEP